jgi:hypothetical protein
VLNRIEVVEKKRQRENDGVLKVIKKWIEKTLPKGTYVFYKNWGGGFNKAGRPDIEITYRGQVNYWELKDEDGMLSTLQIECIAAYKRASKIVYVANSLEEFVTVWKRIFN